MALNYTDTELLQHLEDCSPAQLATINAEIAIVVRKAMVGPITVGSGTSEELDDIKDDIKNRTDAQIEDIGDTSRTGGWGTIIDGLPG